MATSLSGLTTIPTANGRPASSTASTSRVSLSLSATAQPSDPYPSHTSENGTSSHDAPNGYAQPPFAHNEDIVSHLYHQGFQTGNYADTILHVHQNTYRLHAIVLSRSPYLVHLMSTSPQASGQRVVYVPLDHEPEVTQEGFAIALGYLYSSVSLGNLRPENARGVLAAACLLGGMDDLCAHAYDACREHIRADTVDEWLRFVGTPPADGELPAPTLFGPYAQRLRDDVLHFLVDTLPAVLGVPAGAPGARDALLQVFARVPFELFKAAIEAPGFQIGTEQARFKFAKDAIEARRRGIARGTGAEETVVLAFGGANAGGHAVHVTRKMRRKALWKVNAS
ncbi:hypothetical protein FA95DRAFT_1557927 [Auriscalpium vulgare]|uniref:Uncharacterized protein n=1 Tax=Auriscalpium vulgare TaxID=40419 RepID=A0ACB8RWL0_9AGAM|nr:hypothetical protein FA95DRAFT_1557927 [Auriscalpium vulgare]